jgi:hypothetical protein
LPAERKEIVRKVWRKWREDLINDLGGKDAISTQQETLIEMAARSKIILDSIDNWILGQPTLINSRKKTVLFVVQQRQTIADGLLRLLDKLGIQRVAPPPKPLWKMFSAGGKQDEEKRESNSDLDRQSEANSKGDGNDAN